MAFGAASEMFVATIEYQYEGGSFNLGTDSMKIALYSDTPTPDEEVALANTVYGVDQWITGSEEYDAAEWPQTGQVLGSPTSTVAAGVWTFDAADEVSDGTSATLDTYGCLIYDDAVSDYGICFLSFNGSNSVVDGTLTVQFGAGICTITV